MIGKILKNRGAKIILGIIILCVCIAGILLKESAEKKEVAKLAQSYLDKRYNLSFKVDEIIIERKGLFDKKYRIGISFKDGLDGHIYYDKKDGIEDNLFYSKAIEQLNMEFRTFLEEEKEKSSIGTFISVKLEGEKVGSSLFSDYKNKLPSYQEIVKRVCQENQDSKIIIEVDLVHNSQEDNANSLYWVLEYLESKKYYYTEVSASWMLRPKKFNHATFNSEEIKEILEKKDINAIEKKIK